MMRNLWIVIAIALVSGVGRGQTPVPAQTPPAGQGAPTGATGRCNDGSYTKATQKWQACGGHKGVQAWFAASSAGPGTGAAAIAPPNAAAGVDAGRVWVNMQTKVYHCPGGKFYGKTKNGQYMTEADAKKAGARPDRGKPCGL